MNIFAKLSVIAGKIIAGIIILDIIYSLVKIFLVNPGQRYLCAFVLFFIILPAIFIIFFRRKFIAKHPRFLKAWKILRIIYAVIIIL